MAGTYTEIYSGIRLAFESEPRMRTNQRKINKIKTKLSLRRVRYTEEMKKRSKMKKKMTQAKTSR